ncbi:MAG TPA: ABC transporter permease [Pseudonocardiaceae bacterium]|nr:ABC transporter permease [Pseudonocardiaceae bacterium]
MVTVIRRRLVSSVLLLLVVSLISFLLISLLPGSPAVVILGPNAGEAQYRALDHQLGLDRPLWSQYLTWLGHAVRGDFGASWVSGQPIGQELAQRLPVTLSLVLGATVVAALLGVALGVQSAIRSRSARGVVDVISLAGAAIPGFWLGLVLVTAFAVAWPVLPATGYVAFGAGPLSWLRSLVLPWVTLALGGSALIAKQTRDSLGEVLSRPFVRVYVANGLSTRSIVYRHALRNAAVPILTTVGVVFVGLLSGSVLVESVFALPGLGSAAVNATTSHDLPVIQAFAMWFTVLVVAVNLLIDLAYVWVDPRVRIS